MKRKKKKKQVDTFAPREDGPFGLSSKMENMAVSEQVGIVDRSLNVGFEDERGLIGKEIYLARGVGIDGRGGLGSSGGGGGEYHWGGGDGDMGGTKEY